MLSDNSTKRAATAFIVVCALAGNASADVVVDAPGPYTFSGTPSLAVLPDVSTIGLQGSLRLDLIAPNVTSRQFVWTACDVFNGAVPPGQAELALQVRNGTVGLYYYTPYGDSLNGSETFSQVPIPADGLVHHVTVTWKDGAESVLHVDGVGIGSRPLLPFASFATQPGTNVLGGEPHDNGTVKLQFNGTVSNFVLQDTYSYVPGDVNFDNVVNGLDINKIAANWLKTNPTPNFGVIAADANMDDVVNGLDLNLIASNWLKAAPTQPGAGVSVPEPGSMSLLLLGVAIGGLRIVRRRMAK
jgi:hypothetical protein